MSAAVAAAQAGPGPNGAYVVSVGYFVAGLPGAVASRDLPRGTREGLNDWKRTGYGGPCPPIGRHRYFFKLYALDAVLPDLGSPTKAKLEKAIEGHELGRAELMGSYEKRR